MFKQLKPGTVLAIGIVLVMLVQIVPVMTAPALGSYRVIIGYSGDPSQAKLAAKAAGFKILRELDAFNAIVVEVKGVSPGDAVKKARKGFEQHAKVHGISIRYVEPDRKLYAFTLGDSPDIQWDTYNGTYSW